jgi:hypothetical protein
MDSPWRRGDYSSLAAVGAFLISLPIGVLLFPSYAELLAWKLSFPDFASPQNTLIFLIS